MSAAWDDRADEHVDRQRDERLAPVSIPGTGFIIPGDPWCGRPECICAGLNGAPCEEYLGFGDPWGCPRCGHGAAAHLPRCEGCDQPCDAADHEQQDGHGPDCPDPSCTLRVCDAPADHSSCETQADRDGRDAREWAEAWRDERAEWRAEDPL